MTRWEACRRRDSASNCSQRKLHFETVYLTGELTSARRHLRAVGSSVTPEVDRGGLRCVHRSVCRHCYLQPARPCSMLVVLAVTKRRETTGDEEGDQRHGDGTPRATRLACAVPLGGEYWPMRMVRDWPQIK